MRSVGSSASSPLIAIIDRQDERGSAVTSDRPLGRGYGGLLPSAGAIMSEVIWVWAVELPRRDPAVDITGWDVIASDGDIGSIDEAT